MPDLNAWLGSTLALSAWLEDIDRAYNTARVVDGKSVSVVVYRAGTAQAAQTVRLEPISGGQSEQPGATAVGSNLGILIIGYKSHPTVADTDIRRGDWFWHDGQRFDVKHVVPGISDRFLAIAEASEYGV